MQPPADGTEFGPAKAAFWMLRLQSRWFVAGGVLVLLGLGMRYGLEWGFGLFLTYPGGLILAKVIWEAGYVAWAIAPGRSVEAEVVDRQRLSDGRRRSRENYYSRIVYAFVAPGTDQVSHARGPRLLPAEEDDWNPGDRLKILVRKGNAKRTYPLTGPLPRLGSLPGLLCEPDTKPPTPVELPPTTPPATAAVRAQKILAQHGASLSEVERAILERIGSGEIAASGTSLALLKKWESE